MHLFYYKRKEGDKEVTDSFNVNCVVRTFTMPDDTVLVLLNDGHDQPVEKQVMNDKGKISVQRVRDYVQSEIIISAEDAQRLRNLTEIK